MWQSKSTAATYSETIDIKVLVTGVAGFIGMHVAQRLLARGDTVVGIDNLNEYYDPALKHARLAQLAPHVDFKFELMDIADRSAIANLFEREKFDRVVHLAAQAGVRYSLQNPHAYVDSNLVGFVNVLEGCRHNAVQHNTPRPAAPPTVAKPDPEQPAAPSWVNFWMRLPGSTSPV